MGVPVHAACGAMGRQGGRRAGGCHEPVSPTPAGREATNVLILPYALLRDLLTLASCLRRAPAPGGWTRARRGASA